MTAMAPAVEPWLSGRTVVVAAHAPVLLPRFDDIITLAAVQPAVTA